jgi:hypothetical protein
MSYDKNQRNQPGKVFKIGKSARLCLTMLTYIMQSTIWAYQFQGIFNLLMSMS